MNASSDPTDDRLEELLEAHFRGNLSPADKAEFASLLDSSAGARRRFVVLAGFESALTSIHHGLPTATAEPIGVIAARTRRIWLTLPWFAAAACLAVALWLQQVEEPAQNLPPASSQFTARLVNEAGAVFANHRSPGDPGFNPGTYELKEGMVHLRFSSGADLVIEAPARFEIVDAMRTRIHWGQLRSIVPPTAKGFTIATDGVDFEDIGTEFGLRVERGTGASAMHVFEGQVNVRKEGSGALLESVEGGASVAYRRGVSEPLGDLRPGEFIAPGSIGFQRWKSEGEASLSDPGLIAFFPFARDAQQPGVLRNIARAGGIASGTIHGAHWVSGRWPGKDALLFDRLSDFAEIEIPGGFTELTIAVWVSIDRLDHTFNALFDSNGWEKGDLHLQVQRSGFPYVDIRDGVVHGGGKGFGTGVPLGQWCHIAAVISPIAQTATVYVNGRLTYERPLHRNATLRPGLCRIGNWLPADGYEPERVLNGRMDELVIWNRALSHKELEIQVERGRPNFLWSGK